jgi:hypothetical protein
VTGAPTYMGSGVRTSKLGSLGYPCVASAQGKTSRSALAHDPPSAARALHDGADLIFVADCLIQLEHVRDGCAIPAAPLDVEPSEQLSDLKLLHRVRLATMGKT